MQADFASEALKFHFPPGVRWKKRRREEGGGLVLFQLEMGILKQNVSPRAPKKNKI